LQQLCGLLESHDTYCTASNTNVTTVVFGRDAVLNINFQANWKYIKDRKQKTILKNNQRENKQRIVYKYVPGQKVLLKAKFEGKYAGDLFDGPYVVLHVNMNVTVRLKRGLFLETINIRNIKPFNENYLILM
jgi:hypothetical protein